MNMNIDAILGHSYSRPRPEALITRSQRSISLFQKSADSAPR